ncbi:odorant receptor 22c-like isoform X1 [Eupeodes corollae]|uniref:odorant receptor 22c-like isoform X1 n=1 Tax=Eupeodes corollae TaxID=290404 RepID=UPI002492E0B5|nr:odorant receptor 22c-like isoform X1 [Eupeodes corollae]
MSFIKFSRFDPLESAFFRMAKWTLVFLGIWPLDLLNRLTIFKIIFNSSALLTAIIGEIRFAWFIRSEPLEALDAACPSLTKMVTMIKLSCFLIYRNQLATLLNELYEHLYADTENEKKNLLIGKISFFTSVWCLMLFLLSLSTSFLYTVQPIIVWIYQRFTGTKGNWVTLPFQAALPYQDMTKLNSRFVYSLVYCFLAHSGNVTVFGISGADGIFMCFCMYISVSYECLQNDFKTAFNTYCSKNSKSESNGDDELLYNELSFLVKRQQKIIEMFEHFNQTYKLIIFGHFLFASIELGIVLVNIVLSTGITKMIFLTYVLGSCCQLYTYCYGAENVNQNCVKLSETLYFCEWYQCNTKIKRLVLMVLMKSQKGSLLDAPFFRPSLPLFASIIQTSGSYFTILLAFM